MRASIMSLLPFSHGRLSTTVERLFSFVMTNSSLPLNPAISRPKSAKSPCRELKTASPGPLPATFEIAWPTAGDTSPIFPDKLPAPFASISSEVD